jgi:hypothetical protein
VATIAELLASLGMSEYAERFAENDVEIDVLSELTDQDLERLGIALGHRRRMLRAIRELGSSRAATGSERPGSASVTTQPALQDIAERRQLTVMFRDLVAASQLGQSPCIA